MLIAYLILAAPVAIGGVIGWRSAGVIGAVLGALVGVALDAVVVGAAKLLGGD